MITKDNEPIVQMTDGDYIVQHGAYRYVVRDLDMNGQYKKVEIEAYLLAHPEALIPEPLPPEQTPEELAAHIRSQRDTLMRSNVDCYNAARWETMSEAQRDEVRGYRRALLDITEQPTFPASVTWPVEP